MSDGRACFRFRPGRPWTAGLAILLGGALLVSTLAAGGGWTAWAGGAAALLGVLYFASPVWRMEVRVDERGLEVVRGTERRLALRWDEVVRVTVAPAHRTAFVDGGSPERSLLLPGRGARAPYRIENQVRLLDAIRRHVAPDRQVEVDRLDRLPAGGPARA